MIIKGFSGRHPEQFQGVLKCSSRVFRSLNQILIGMYSEYKSPIVNCVSWGLQQRCTDSTGFSYRGHTVNGELGHYI